MSASEILNLLKAAQSQPVVDDLHKGFTQTSTATQGLQQYDLEAPAKLLIPVLTPLRNRIPRRLGGVGSQANWKAITGINTANQRAGVSEGNRAGLISQTTAEYLAAYRAWGLENNVTFEADLAAQGFMDLKALAVQQVLQALMIQEERLDLGGNTSLALGTTPTPTLVAGTVGSMATQAAASVICVALGPQAYLDVAGANNGATGQIFDPTTAQVPGRITKTNTDASSDAFGGGSAKQSASATVSVTGPTGSIAATVAPVKGAWGYAWYVGASAGTERLAAITSINSVVLTTYPGVGQLASAIVNAAADNSTSTLDYDGIYTQAAKAGSNAYWATLPTGVAGTGTALTSDGAGGIADFELAFASFYNNYRLSPTLILVSAQECINVTKKIIANGGAPLIRFQMDAKNIADGKLSAGVVIGSYLNKVMNVEIPIQVHPNLPPGTILFYTDQLPYPLNGVADVVRKKLRRDYYQMEWPLKSRKYEYGVYADGVLQHYAPFSLGVITNITNG
jgi:hypothetical protein